jgi:hypothetical protein
MSREVYITATDAHLPGEPLDNDAIARRLDSAGIGRGMRSPVLAANGIRTRHDAARLRGRPSWVRRG